MWRNSVSVKRVPHIRRRAAITGPITMRVSQNYKISFSGFCGRRAQKYPHWRCWPGWWQLQILNFWVNLQNSNCISYCVPSPAIDWSPDTAWTLDPVTRRATNIICPGQRLSKSLAQIIPVPPPPPSPSDHPFFRHKASLSYFVNVTKRPQRIGRHSFLMKNHISIWKAAILVQF